jgi:S-formylglutathione hydrolase FrmB
MRKLGNNAAGIAAFIVAALVCAAPAAAEQKLITIDVPSKYVDVSQVKLAGANHPKKLQANVLLPDGYDGKKKFPLLLLLHGASGRWDSWSSIGGGNIKKTAAGLNAVVVMPDGGATGFYTNWWNRGARGKPEWERYFRDELIPRIQHDFRILPQRRYHTIAGLSMGGYGTLYLASQMPGFFGSAVPMSAVASLQRATDETGLKLVASIDYSTVFGPLRNFYATGHNPLALAKAGNFSQTRIDDYVGTGVPSVKNWFIGNGLSQVAELELRLQNDETVAALRNSGAPVTYTVKSGTHDWPYWQDDLRIAISRGLFPPVGDDRTHWKFTTVSQQGDAWGLRFQFAGPTTGLVKFDRAGRRLIVTGGASAVTLFDSGGCRIEAKLPAELKLPAKPCKTKAKKKAKKKKKH